MIQNEKKFQNNKKVLIAKKKLTLMHFQEREFLIGVQKIDLFLINETNDNENNLDNIESEKYDFLKAFQR